MDKSLNMKSFFEHIVSVCRKYNTGITHPKLQKIAYLTLKEVRDKQLLSSNQLIKIYDKPFYVWAYGAYGPYGPYNPKTHHKYKLFKHAPIIDIHSKELKELQHLNPIILKYSKQKLNVLIEQSQETPFWKRNNSHIRGFTSKIPYRLEDL